MRVLLIDDNSELRDFLCASLQESGIDSAGVASADNVTNQVESDNFDVLIVDSVLGEGDGIGLISQIRKGEKGRAIPVILMSPIGTSLARRMASDAGCNEFLLKPFGLAKFIEILRRVA